MKFFILLFAVVAIAHAEFTAEDEERWLQYKLEHGKLFLSPGKEQVRKETFLENAKKIDTHNARFLRGEVSFVQKINKWSDMPEEEFNAKHLGIILPDELEEKLHNKN